MSAYTAIKAAKDNIEKHVSANRDPVMYNVNVALLNIARAIQSVESKLDDIEKRVKRLE